MTELVCLADGLCPDCTTPLDRLVADEPALVRHGGYGGYGATRRTVTDWCHRCGWSLTAEIAERAP